MRECDNKSRCHDPITIFDNKEAVVIYCKSCYNKWVVRKYPIKEVPERRLFAKLFKRDILQPRENLFYKYYPQYMSR